MSLKDRLEIILITYNRKAQLMQTLLTLLHAKSPVRDFKIRVLDNHSSDGTQEIVDMLAQNHPNLQYSQNPYNIGIGGNIARAMEIASMEYLWTICDDDDFEWEHWPSVEESIYASKEIICVSDFVLGDNHRAEIPYVLYQFGFLPSLIIKRALFNDTVMHNAFSSIYTMFPHLAPIVSFINQGKMPHVINGHIVSPGQKASDLSYTRGNAKSDLFNRSRTMNVLIGYANIVANINDRPLSKKCFHFLLTGDFYHRYGRWQFFRDLFLRMNWENNAVDFADLFILCSLWEKIFIIIIYLIQKSWLYPWVNLESSVYKIAKSLFQR